MLGDETRLTILQALGEADDPLAFSDLFDRVQYDDASNFNYHLKKLRGPFVHKTEAGYALRQAGRRVIEAVLAEAPGEDTAIDRTGVDQRCFRCDAQTELSYHGGHVGLYCSSCGGTRGDGSRTTVGRTVESGDVLGLLDLPPAGVVDRTPTDVLDAARFWTTSEAAALARELCPRCSAPLEHSRWICGDHDATDGHCDACGQQFAVVLDHNCTNCIYSVVSPFATYLLDTPELIGFIGDHGVDPLALAGFHLSRLDEEIRSTEPFEATVTFTADGEALSLTVDDDLSVVDVTRHPADTENGG